MKNNIELLSPAGNKDSFCQLLMQEQMPYIWDLIDLMQGLWLKILM